MSQQSLQTIFSQARQGNLAKQSQMLNYGRRRGFQTFLNRKLIWPFLLGLDLESISSSVYEWEVQMDQNSKEFKALQIDAERAMANMKAFENITKFHLQKKQRDVLKVLSCFFAKNTNLTYFQGFHDVASIFLILFGNKIGFYMMQKAGRTYFRDFLTKQVTTIGRAISQLVMGLLLKKDRKFEQYFSCFSEQKILPFILPWVFTWFANAITSVKTICRIWDYILCSGPHGIIYLTAGLILISKERMIKECSYGHSESLDSTKIQLFFEQLFSNQEIDMETAIKVAIQLEESFSLTKFSAYNRFDADSMFCGHNFSFQISIHREVSQYNEKERASRESFFKKMTILSVMAIMGGLFYLKHSKK